MDKTHSPYASAQRILDVISDYPDLWEPGGGAALMALLDEWNESPTSA